MDDATIERARSAVARLREVEAGATPGPWSDAYGLEDGEGAVYPAIVRDGDAYTKVGACMVERDAAAIVALRNAAPGLIAVARAVVGLHSQRPDPAWWGHWSRPDLDGVRFVVCDQCGRQGLPGGYASTVDHKNCPALALDAALAALADAGGEVGE